MVNQNETTDEKKRLIYKKKKNRKNWILRIEQIMSLPLVLPEAYFQLCVVHALIAYYSASRELYSTKLAAKLPLRTTGTTGPRDEQGQYVKPKRGRIATAAQTRCKWVVFSEDFFFQFLVGIRLVFI